MDPPLLFIFVMEASSTLLRKVVKGSLLRVFEVDMVGFRGVISHLLYANDTLIFCDMEEDQIWILRAVLCFKPVTRLKINLRQTTP